MKVITPKTEPGCGRGRKLGEDISSATVVQVLPVFVPFCPRIPSLVPNGTGTGAWGAYTASSNHPGGVNIALMDGSGRMVNDSVSTGNLDGLQGGAGNNAWANSGKSNFGVWGALGTPSAGDSSAL